MSVIHRSAISQNSSPRPQVLKCLSENAAVVRRGAEVLTPSAAGVFIRARVNYIYQETGLLQNQAIVEICGCRNRDMRGYRQRL